MAAINIESNDHNNVYNIVCKNYIVNDCQTPIFLILQNRNNKLEGEIGNLHNVTVQNFTCNYSTRASQINVGCGGGKIRNIIIDTITIHNYEIYAETISPILPDGLIYPEATNYGRMPAFGLFARETDSLKFQGDINFFDNSITKRPMIWVENVTNLVSDNFLIEENIVGSFSCSDALK